MCQYLYDKGHTVTINAMTKAKTYGDWKVHADKGDLEVLWNGVPKRIEVKGISTDFVDASDWKFPDFIVCALIHGIKQIQNRKHISSSIKTNTCCNSTRKT